MLRQIDDDIWIAEGENVPFLGIPYPTRMTLVRLRDGGLWVHSPIRLVPELIDTVKARGPVRCVVAPNKLHHLFLSEWADAWPEATIYAPPGLRRKRGDLRLDADLGDDPPAAWAQDIDQVMFRGSFALVEVVFFHRRSRTLIVTDLIQKFDPSTLNPFHRLVMRLDGMLGPEGSTPREWRLSFWNRRQARVALHTALGWDPERIVIAHGTWVTSDGREALRRSLRWLSP